MIHATNLSALMRCKRLGWEQCQNRSHPEMYAHMPQPFPSIYLPYLKAEGFVSGKAGDSTQISLKKLENQPGGINIRLEAKGVRVKIPVLKRLPEGGWHAVYPVLSCTPKEHEGLLFALNRHIAGLCGIDIVRHSVVYLNKDYVRTEALEPEKLLLETDTLFKKSGRPMAATIDELLDRLEPQVLEALDLAPVLLHKEAPEPVKCKTCTSPRKCSWYETCWKEEQLPDGSSRFLSNSGSRMDDKTGKEAFLKGIRPEDIQGFPLQYAQIMADKNGGVFMDVPALKHWVSSLQYPLIYLDFEWDSFAVPPYGQMKPFDVLCFQFSMHIEQEDGHLEHVNFFGEKDCRQAFLDRLLSAIPKEGSVLVYNMEGAEKLRLMQLADQFPQYRQQIEQVCLRMVDLSLPFENGMYYSLAQRGRYSIKNLLPLFAGENGYKNLQIQDGLEAIRAYRKIEASSDGAEKKQLARAISEYCAMDTYAEILLLAGLKEQLCQREEFQDA